MAVAGAVAAGRAAGAVGAAAGDASPPSGRDISANAASEYGRFVPDGSVLSGAFEEDDDGANDEVEGAEGIPSGRCSTVSLPIGDVVAAGGPLSNVGGGGGGDTRST
jgi:hypothetical protein